MTCAKSQLVRLTDTALLLADAKPDDYTDNQQAKVLSVIEMDGEPGTRRVQLDRRLAGERHWLESDLEAAE